MVGFESLNKRAAKCHLVILPVGKCDWQLLAGLQGLTFQNNFEGIKLKPKQLRTALNYI